jgi:hypothetical protein
VLKIIFSICWACDERDETNSVGVVMKTNVEGKRGRPKNRWLDTIENDTRTVSVNVGDV